MNNVLRFSTEDWLLMLTLKKTINYMVHKDYTRFRLGILKDKEIYKDTIDNARKEANG